MSMATYQIGAQAVALQILTVRCQQEPVYDGPSYRYTAHQYEIFGHVNRALNYHINNSLAVGGNPAVVGADGRATSSPAEKLSQLTKFMLQPRGRFLLLHDDGTKLMESPKDGRLVDASLGPMPERFDVLNFTGTEDIYVRWVITVSEHACTNPPLLISHRWRQASSVDWSGYETRTTRGVALFHVGKMMQLGVVPDEFRNALIPQQPDGYERVEADAEALPDGDGISYVVQDRQLSHSANRICTRMTCFHTTKVIQPGVDLSDFRDSLGGFLTNLGDAITTSFLATPLTGMSQFVSRQTGQSTRFAVSKLPQHWTFVSIQAWGDAYSKRYELQKLALAVATARLQPLLKKVQTNRNAGGGNTPTQECELTVDAMGKYVALNLSVRHGPGFNTTSYLGPLLSPNSYNFRNVAIPESIWLDNESEDLLDVNTKQILIKNNATEPRQNYTAPFGARGTSTKSIVSQWFQGICRKPAERQDYEDPVASELKRRGIVAENTEESVIRAQLPEQTTLQSQPPSQSTFTTGGGQSTLRASGGD